MRAIYASSPWLDILGIERLGDECEEAEVDDQGPRHGWRSGWIRSYPTLSGGKTETAVSATAIQALRLAGMQVALP
jgi:hypothetical protein